ncbi:MAG: hypothetical protein Q7U10_00315 [Thermodesulfovibrionia bacterium]|nr:hypothetical protein [Thermodesulfovibrionia bacterium]
MSNTWKKELAEHLQNHKDLKGRTGQVEINLNEGGITKVYLTIKEVKGDTTIFRKKEIK